LANPTANSLVDLLELRAQQDDGTFAFTFLAEEGNVEQRLTYKELDFHARLIASRIMESAAPGERVLLLYPPGLEFFPAFFGCLYAAVMAVPAYPPHRNRNLLRLQSIFHDAQPRLVLTTAALVSKIKNVISSFGGGAGIDVIATDNIPAGESNSYIRPKISSNTIAFLQYTSGSTADPKGVLLTHENLLHNASLVNDAVDPVPDDSYVSWLPVFHDMGFMAGILQPLYRGLPAVLMAPASFLEKPVRWLQAISRYKATASGGPSFAYELCVRRIPKDDLAGIDLNSWSVAFNGAEPVRADVMERFAMAFAKCGFRRNAFYPCYGLAEATLMVSGSRKGHPFVVGEFDKRDLENDRVCQPGDHERVQGLVACGKNLPGQEIAIVNPHSHERCAQDQVGEIWVRGKSVAAGYWNRPELTQEIFHAHVAGAGAPFLRTGDLGFLHNEQLFVTGRIKDLLIIRGQNHYPQDIELTVEACDSVLQPGSGAAFSVEAGNEERLVVAQEAANRANSDWEKTFASIRRAIAENHELSPHAIVLIRAGTIPKTSSGKIQRWACKEAFLTGKLRTVATWYEQENERASSGESELLMDELIHSVRSTQLIREVARKAGVTPERIDLDQPLTAYGLDSLAAVELVHWLQMEFGLDLKMADLFEGLTLAEIVRQVEHARIAEPEFHRPASGLQAYPLTHGQRAIWFLQQMAPQSSAYNIARAIRITSKIEIDLLQQSLQALVDRHAVLRTTFASSHGEPFQQVQAAARVCFESVDASALSKSRFDKILSERSEKIFDLANGPLFCAYLFRRSEKDHVLQLVVHHLIADFWSLMVLLDELGKLYRAKGDIGVAGLPPLRYSYSDFVSWQDQLISGIQGKALWAYWEQVLSSEIASLNLPGDHPRPPISTFRGNTLEFVIEPALAAEIKKIALGQQTTLFMVLLAAFQVLLYRLTAQTRFAVGVPTSGRSRAELSDLVGYFVNVLPLIADFTERKTFTEFLTDVRRRSIKSFAHDLYPFPLMVEKLGIPRSFNSSPIFQTMFVFQKTYAKHSADFAALAMGEKAVRLDVGGLECEAFPVPEQTAQFDLVLTMSEGQAGLLGAWQYSTDIFNGDTVARWSQSFLQLLRGIVANPGRLLSELRIIPENECTRLLFDFNQTELKYDHDEAVYEQISRHAILNPDRTAVVFGTIHLSFGDLNTRANQIAHYLCRRGVGTEDLVAICMRRTPEMIAAMLGVWKAGAAYVPLDHQYPHERLRFMLEDAGAKAVLTEQELRSKVEGTAAWVVTLNEISELKQESSAAMVGTFISGQLAYVIYTSGSTGIPKGVMLTHHNILSFVAWARHTFSPEEFSGVLAATSICFDLSIFELWATLSCGGTVILVENILQWCDAWPHATTQPQVRLINTVPSAMEKLLERPFPAGVSTINLAGEPLHESLVRKIFAAGDIKRVNNLYGPTETTTYSSWTNVTDEANVTIGQGIGNTQLYVLDAEFQLAPLGAVGEIYIGGAGLARGYWRHSDWSAERFVPNPFSRIPGERLFRTGDLARWRADGQLLYLGRVDQQVKIRGFRIELGEISAVLGQWEAVRENAVVVIEDRDDRYLVAYVVPRADEEMSLQKIREYLQHRLPEYMLPTHLVLLADLPKTSSGKIDRKSLPRPQLLTIPGGRMPATDTEREIAAVWQEVLKIEQVGAEDDFFLLGGHSLLMMQIKARMEARMRRTISLAQLLKSPTVAGMAKSIEPGHPIHLLPSVLHIALDGPVELSFAQERIWLFEQMNPGLSVYNVAGAVRLQGELNKQAMRESLQKIVQRHAVLRTAFISTEMGPRQKVCEEGEFELKETDLQSGLNSQKAEELLRKKLEEEAKRPFDLGRAGLIRARLMQTGERDYTLIVVLHHIVADGWSIGVLLKELEELYRAYCNGKPSALPALNSQFTDYAIWERRLHQTGNMNEGLAYWKGQLSGAPTVLDLPVDMPRPAASSYRGNVVRFGLSHALSENLKRLCHREGITPYVLLLGCFQILLSRYSGQTDIVVGSPVANRQEVESEKLIGLFANLVPIRGQIENEEKFASSLQHLKASVVQAQAWQYVPFEKVAELVETQRDASRMPLVQVVFAWQIGLMGQMRMGDVIAQPQAIETGTSKFDLMLTIEEDKDSELIAWIEYNKDIFNQKTIQRMAARYVRLVEQAVSHPGQRVGDLSLVDEHERKQILTEWNGSPLHPKAGCVHSWFEEQARLFPEAIAVEADDRSLTYRDLNAIANRVAHELISRGIRPEMVVGICFERNEWMIVAMLATLKAGAAYLSLDHEYPSDRLAYMLDDAGVVFLLAEQAAMEKLPRSSVPSLVLDHSERWQKQSADNPGLRVQESSLAYVIYTSGSTGQPKGVMVQHGNLAGLLSAANTYFKFRQDDRWSLFHLYSFDFSVWEIWGALGYGGSLVIVPSAARRSPREFHQLLMEKSVSILSQVPSAFYQLLDYEEQTGEAVHLGLRAIVFGGEALDVKKLESWIRLHGEDNTVLVNMYGITETTIHVTYKLLRSDDVTAGRSVVGAPLPGYSTWLLDQRQMLLPPGIPGEIYVGGIGVARGYLSRPALTAERFVPDPFGNNEGGRLYRTGDLGRYLSDGTIEYMGRLDHQVKLRGYRIELGEIELALKRHVDIHDCIVLIKPESQEGQRLVAYIVTVQSAHLRPAELRTFLRSGLPDYMVPTQFIFLDRLPLTANGKTDRKQLVQLEAGMDIESSGPASLDPVEELVAGVWSDLLRVTDLSAESNFFVLGGHSVLATRMVLQLRRVFGCDVALRSVFELPTLGLLAAHIKELSQVQDSGVRKPILRRNEDGRRQLSSAQQRLWFLDEFSGSSHAYNITGAARLKGELNVEALRQSFQSVILRHEVLHTGFVERQGRPQLIHVQVPFELEMRDLRGCPEPADRLVQELRQESIREFVLSRPPLLRAILFQLGEQEHVLMVAMHHIIADAWSIAIMIRELAQFYASHQMDGNDTAELPFQYPDYAAWEHERWANGDLSAGLEYWRKQLAGMPRLELPADFSRGDKPDYRGQTLKASLSAGLSQKMKALSRKENVTLFMLLLAGFQAQLSQYTGEADIVVGTSMANRNIAGTEDLIGLFTNEVVLRTQLHGDPSFRELLARVREVTLSAYAHQGVPFGKLVEVLQPQRDFSRNPFFQTTVLFQEDPISEMKFGDLSLEPVELELETAIFDLSLMFTLGSDGEIRVSLRHSIRFKTEKMERLLQDLVAVYGFIFEKPEGHVSELRKILMSSSYSPNPDKVPVPVGRPWSDLALTGGNIPLRFEQQVLATPGRTAVCYEQKCLTFAELNESANKVANHLLKVGVKAEDYVAICLERSVEMIVAILGILKAGAAYVPLDRTYPTQRLNYILGETAAAAIVTQYSLADLFTDALRKVICIDDDLIAKESAKNPEVIIHPENLAYAIYTSGSTGSPKGVMIQHQSVLNLLQGLDQAVYCKIVSPACVSMNAPVVFDASVKQWVRILKGDTVCIVPEEKRFDPEALVAYINQKNIDLLDCTPSLLRLMLSEGAVRSARAVPSVVLIGGEAIDASTWSHLRAEKQIDFYNVYGPTECTVDVSVCRISQSSQPSIGDPISNVYGYIVNDSLQPLPLGEIGELCVAGAGLARGYCKQPDLTAERFVPDSVSGVAGSRLYRTGDLARFLPGGQTEFCGRRDDQVKIRGYRVELEEITALLRRSKGVRDAVVLMSGGNTGQSNLFAYVVLEPDTTLNAEQLRSELRQQIPEYMIPSGFMMLDQLPFTVNGKVDRKALILMSEGQRVTSSAYSAARNQTEEVVTAIWREVLGLRQAGIHDNFFELGGHSLAMVQVRSRLREVFNKEVPMVELFRNPTIALLSRYLEEGQAGNPSMQLAQSRASKRITAANRISR
jgi:amino acid adenylation domain-containing protein